jgi:hypothetical protein
MRDAVLTIVALLLAFCAFDDITTGNESSFTTEYAALLFCAVWLLFVSVRLLRGAHRLLGGISLFALAGAVWSHRVVAPGSVPGLWTEYVVMAVAFLWFAGLSLILAGLTRHQPSR